MKRSRPQRKTRMKPVNRKRKAKLYALQFGDHADWIRTLGCLVCGRTPSEPAHVKTRGSGGTAKDIVPLCGDRPWSPVDPQGHHSEQEGNNKRFEALYRIDLKAEAARLWAENGGDDG